MEVVPMESMSVVGLWSSSDGLEVSIRKVGQTFEILTPSKALALVPVAEFPDDTGTFHRNGVQGKLTGRVLVWRNGDEWTKDKPVSMLKWLDPKYRPPKSLNEMLECLEELEKRKKELYVIGVSFGLHMDVHQRDISWLNERLTHAYEAYDSLDSSDRMSRPHLLEKLKGIEHELSQLKKVTGLESHIEAPKPKSVKVETESIAETLEPIFESPTISTPLGQGRMDVVGMWLSSDGEQVSIRKVGQTFEILTPSKALALVPVAEFPDHYETFHCNGVKGKLEGGVLVWTNGIEWTRDKPAAVLKWLDPKYRAPKSLNETIECLEELEKRKEELYIIGERFGLHMAHHQQDLSWLNERLTHAFEARDSFDSSDRTACPDLLEKLKGIEYELSQLKKNCDAASREEESNGSVTPDPLPLSSNGNWVGKTVQSWVLGDAQDVIVDDRLEPHIEARKPKRAKVESESIEKKLELILRDLRAVKARIRQSFVEGFTHNGFELIQDQRLRLHKGKLSLGVVLSEIDRLAGLCDDDSKIRKEQRILANSWIKQCDSLDNRLKQLLDTFEFVEL